jgi:MoaA/NifB/PqqE/SkfB family radical SAM enzyme
MKLADIRKVLEEAAAAGINDVWFEGGEPFLYYATMLESIRFAKERGFTPGIVTNGYWATSIDDAKAWLRPLEGMIGALLISCDSYHARDEKARRPAENAEAAAKALGFSPSILSVAGANESGAPVMFRGRAAEKLLPESGRKPWAEFTKCPYENPLDPARLHIDPFGNLHFCQGISLGNVFANPLRQIIESTDPGSHPVLAPLAAGGPAELARRHGVCESGEYADACHLCYSTRAALRSRFPETLLPDGMYGIL